MRIRGRELTYGAFIFTVLAAFFLSTYILSIVVKFGLGLGVVCMVMAVVCIATKYLSDKEKDGYIKELNEMTTAIQQQGALVKCKKIVINRH